MKFRTFIISLAVVVFALLLTAGAGAAWIFANSPVTRLQAAIDSDIANIGSFANTGSFANKGENSVKPAASMFVSRQSPLVASLRVNPDRLLAAKLLTAPAQRKDIQEGFYQLQQAFLPDAQLNYSRDIQPWLGDEITLAITTPDFDRDSTNGTQLGYLVALTIADPALAQRTLQTFWQRHSRTKEKISELYAGVEIVYRDQAKRAKKKGDTEKIGFSDAPTLATAVVGDRFVLLANSPKVLRAAINNVQVEELNLAHSDVYQQALDQLPSKAIGLAWVNLPQLLAGVRDETESQSASSLLATWSLDSQGLKSQILKSQSLKSRSLKSQPATQGLVADIQLLPAIGQPFALNQATQTAPVGALRFIPAESAWVASGIDLQHQLASAWVSSSDIRRWVKRSLDSSLQRQILLPEDAASWITGEYALAMLPHENGSSDWIFVTERSPEALAGLERLDAIAQSHNVALGSFTLETPAGNQEIFAWTKFSTQPLKPSATAPALSLAAEVQGVRATIEDYEIFATSLEAMNAAILSPKRALLDKADFRGAIAALKQNNQGYLYWNQSALRDWIQRSWSQQGGWQVDQQTDQQVAPSLKPLLDRLQSVTFSSYGQSEAIVRGSVSLQMMEP